MGEVRGAFGGGTYDDVLIGFRRGLGWSRNRFRPVVSKLRRLLRPHFVRYLS